MQAQNYRSIAAAALRRCRDSSVECNGDIGHIDNVNPDDGELTATSTAVPSPTGLANSTRWCRLRRDHPQEPGLGYLAVVIPIMTQHYAMLQRNLPHSGVTRGKRLVVLVGQKKAVAMPVRNVSDRRRWFKLGEWLASQNGSAPTPGKTAVETEVEIRMATEVAS